MILVVGATGDLGGLIAESLLSRRHDVRVLVRDPRSRDAFEAAGAETVLGDLKDPASLAAACIGADSVVTTANSSARGGPDTVESVDRVGNRALVDAATAQGVGHLVLVSALGADPHHPVPFLRAKGETEERLQASGMGWTVLQPNLYLDKLPMAVVGGPALAGRPVMLVGEGRRRHSLVAARDVAAYAVAALEDERSHGQTLRIGGPEAVTWREVVAAFEHELGRALDVSTVPTGQAPPGMPDFVVEVLRSLENHDSPLDMAPLSAAYAVRPTTMAEFVHDYVARSRHPVG